MMRSVMVGIVIGAVTGVTIGTTIIAPRLDQSVPRIAKSPVSDLEISASETLKTQIIPNTATTLPPGKPTVRWRMASAYSGALPQLGSMALRIGRNIWKVSDGNIEIKFFEPKTLVPSSEIFEAVASGAIDAAFSSSGFWSDRETSLQLFSTVPFGPQPGEYLAWIYFGGGEALLNEIYQAHGIHSVICGMIGSASSGWYRRSFTTSDDLKGLKMRTSGLAAKVLNKLGVKTLSLKGADIFLAFENGEIDAAEFSTPAIDLKLGLHELANHYYFPGWHQPSSFFELIINKDQWDALTETEKSQIEAVCGDNIRHGLAEGEALQYDALKSLTAKGVKIKRWPTPILTALEGAWNMVAVEQSAADAKFKRVWRSLSNFRKDYAIWKELSQP